MKFEYSDEANWQRIVIARAIERGEADTLPALVAATGIARATVAQRLLELVFWGRVALEQSWDSAAKKTVRRYSPRLDTAIGYGRAERDARISCLACGAFEIVAPAELRKRFKDEPLAEAAARIQCRACGAAGARIEPAIR